MKKILIGLLFLSTGLSAQTFDFSCGPQYDNDCNCDPGGSYSGFLATPGNIYNTNADNNVGIVTVGNFTGSIYSRGNEEYAAIYAITGSFFIVGDTVYNQGRNNRDLNFVAPGVYTQNNTIFVPGSCGDGSCDIQSVTPWSYTIGELGIIIDISQGSLANNDGN